MTIKKPKGWLVSWAEHENIMRKAKYENVKTSDKAGYVPPRQAAQVLRGEQLISGPKF